MKSFSFLFLVFLLSITAVVRADDDPAAPRILALAEDAPHPKALIQSIDPEHGVLLFAWLDDAGHQVDSGNSIARFTPVITTAATDDAPAIYADPDDAILIAAIAAATP